MNYYRRICQKLITSSLRLAHSKNAFAAINGRVYQGHRHHSTFQNDMRVEDRMVTGRATKAATSRFMKESEWPLHHYLRRTNLFINPIIHGPPKVLNINDYEKYDMNFAYSLIHNRSNCLFIYDHRGADSWHTTSLHEILSNSEQLGISRDEVVTVAGLGRLQDPEEIHHLLRMASNLTRIEHIDIAVFEVDEKTLLHGTSHLLSILQEFEHLCEAGTLSSYGVKMNVPPYSYHTPPLSRVGEGVAMPILMEELMSEHCVHAEMVLYNISPSHAIPASYPSLVDPDTDTEEIAREMSRPFTRVSYDPLTCWPGLGDGSEEDFTDLAIRQNSPYEPNLPNPTTDVVLSAEDEVVLMDDVMPEDMQAVLGTVLDELCPALRSTAKLQDKALRIVLSVGVDAVVLDSFLSASIGPCQLTAKDLLTSTQTDDVFGGFMIPRIPKK